MFEGSIVALVTPFRNGQVDEPAFRKLIRFHLENGTSGILVSGCTGEAANVSLDELKRMIAWAREEMHNSDQEVQLLAGTGTNSTSTSIERTEAVSGDVDGVLLITPYYNKPTPLGQIAHFKEVAAHSSAPVILYNVPGRTGTKMLPETIAELGRIDNIVAVKEASGDIDAVSHIRLLSSITVLSGDDTLTLPMMAVGAAGVISVTANIAPALVFRMCHAWKTGKVTEARELHEKLFLLSKAMFIETNPMPVKSALAMMGFIAEEFRLPLLPIRPESKARLRNILAQNGLLVD